MIPPEQAVNGGQIMKTKKKTENSYHARPVIRAGSLAMRAVSGGWLSLYLKNSGKGKKKTSKPLTATAGGTLCPIFPLPLGVGG
jgi:hypothetical protein